MGEGEIAILPLSEVFTAAGALAWAAAIAMLVQFAKRVSFIPIPETGRGVLFAVAVLAALVVGLAAWDLSIPLNANGIVLIVFTWANLGAAAIGAYEAASKTGRVLSGSTNPSGPDEVTGGPDDIVVTEGVG